MDSKPLHCLPKGSVVTVLKSKVSHYNILSRRVFVRHVAKDPHSKVTTVSEGWASVQSSQGYVILSRLISLCFNNTKWGSTRPIMKQCGHAAHTRCVETHMLSLHQRAAGDQPYDGRFAANINDGEFLCPLCKQLSNILIPRDSRATCEASVPAELPKSDGSIRQLLLRGRMQSLSLNKLKRNAFEDYGTQLYNSMCVPWDRTSPNQKVKQGCWLNALQNWDFEDQLEDSNPPVCVKNLMRLLRQQLISWAAIGHSAAALDASSRGVEVVFPFGTVSETSDPWPEYGTRNMDTHAMLLELKRNLTGSSGLLEILLLAMSEIYSDRVMKPNEATYLGTCLADILDGSSWILNITSVDAEKSNEVKAWGCISALIAAIPCHVARDGTIPLSSDAKAAAAAMWTLRGLSFDESKTTEPPVPLAVRQFLGVQQPLNSPPSILGTLCPFVDVEHSNPSEIYLPGVASGFLYTPLLAWDLYTLSGAVMSSILANRNSDLPTSDQVLHLGHLLLVGRIVQAVITPCGVDISGEMDIDEDDCWRVEEINIEGSSLAKLFVHCREMVKSNCITVSSELKGDPLDISPLALLSGIGKAILPFARSLVLMLRAFTASLRERRGKNGVPSKQTEADKVLDSALCSGEILTKEDGFHILKALHSPSPSSLVSGDWFALINRWLVSTIGLERYHGLMGNGEVITSPARETGTDQQLTIEDNIEMQRSDTPMKCDESFEENMDDDHGVAEGDDTGDIENDESFPLEIPDPLSPGVDMDDSDEELADSMDDQEEMMMFENLPGMGGITSRLNPATSNNHLDVGDLSDHSTESPDGEYSLFDLKFANVANSPIICYQPSLLGIAGVGPGRNGSIFDFTMASDIMSDMSHLGNIHRNELPSFRLIRLPKSFVELYNLVNKIKGRENDHTAMGDEFDDIGTTETSICLLTGTVMRSGSARRMYSRAIRQPGACTIHARKTASGIGIFFLVQKCTILLMHNNKSAYSPSIYVDEHGEEDPQLKRGLPLYLNEARYRALELLWRQQCIPREVAQIRSTSDRVIRDNWY
jgi:Proteolysis_6 C-terminal